MKDAVDDLPPIEKISFPDDFLLELECYEPFENSWRKLVDSLFAKPLWNLLET